MTVQSSFWARRKAAVAAEQEAEARAAVAAKEEARAAALSEKSDEEICAELGLPDPEEMKQGDDFAAFLSREVPEHLRRKALRSLWRSNPVLACVDGLNDYDDDYRIAAAGAEALKTAYQVGKGMTYHLEEMARQAEAKESDETVREDEPGDATVAGDTEDEGTAQAFVQAADAEEPSGPQGDEAEPDGDMPALRRMRFHFEETSA